MCILYYQYNKFHWVANLRENFNTDELYNYVIVEVDIKVFILTVLENSSICKFSRIYLIEFENIKKSTEITLLARTLAISFTIFVFVLQIFTLHFIFNFCWSQQKKRTIKFISSYFSYNYRLYLYSDFKIYYPLSQIETTRGRTTRLILAPGQMYSELMYNWSLIV